MDQRVAFTTENMRRMILERIPSRKNDKMVWFMEVNNRTVIRLKKRRTRRLEVLFHMAGKCGIGVFVEGSYCPDLDFFLEKLEEVRIEKGMKMYQFYGVKHPERRRAKMLETVKADIELKLLDKNYV